MENYFYQTFLVWLMHRLDGVFKIHTSAYQTEASTISQLLFVRISVMIIVITMCLR